MGSWIRAGRVLVDAHERKPSYTVRSGDRVEVSPASAAPLHAEAEDIPLTILFEDESMVLVDKPAGMVVHAGAGNHSGTLVNALLHRFAQFSTTGGEDRPGIVHRLDRTRAACCWWPKRTQRIARWPSNSRRGGRCI